MREWPLIFILGILVGGILALITILPTPVLYINTPAPETVIRSIDLPEEIDVISSNKFKPDTLIGYRENKTLHIGFK